MNGIEASGYWQAIVGDIDGDRMPEVIAWGPDAFFDPTTRIFALNHDGTIVDGFPIVLLGQDSSGEPCLVDLDQDGDIELGILTDNGDPYNQQAWVHFWDLPFPYRSRRMEWPTFSHDMWHTSNYHHRSDKPPKPLPGLEPVPTVLTLALIGAALRRLRIRHTRALLSNRIAVRSAPTRSPTDHQCASTAAQPGRITTA